MKNPDTEGVESVEGTEGSGAAEDLVDLQAQREALAADDGTRVPLRS